MGSARSTHRRDSTLVYVGGLWHTVNTVEALAGAALVLIVAIKAIALSENFSPAILPTFSGPTTTNEAGTEFPRHT